MKALPMFALLLAIGAAFAGGYVYRAVNSGSSRNGVNASRKVLYWVDPMHPAYKSDKPGIAPDCGMKLEPVYADSGMGGSALVAPAVSAAGVAKPTAALAYVVSSCERASLTGSLYTLARPDF